MLIEIAALFTGTDRQVYGEMRVSSMMCSAFFASTGGYHALSSQARVCNAKMMGVVCIIFRLKHN
jgi:hypothetical protein